MDYYLLLGIEKDATAEQIRKAYRKMAIKFHPDRSEMSLCDPIAVICLFHDNEFVYNMQEVIVETNEPKRGLTIPLNKNGNVAIATDLNSIKVMNLIDKSLT